MFRKSFRKNQNQQKRQEIQNQQDIDRKDTLSSSLDENIQTLQAIYENCFDVIFFRLVIAQKMKAVLIYIEGLTNTDELDDHVVSPLLSATEEAISDLDKGIKNVIHISKMKEVKTIQDCIQKLSTGNTILLIESINKGYALGTEGEKLRAIEEPAAEGVVRGPRDGFIESIAVNTSILRGKIRNPLLKMEMMTFGKYTNTKVVIIYMKDLADEALIKEMKSRLQKVQLDGVLESGYIEEIIEDNSYSPFPQLLNTERPDVVAANLLSGRIALLVDGSPTALIAPVSFVNLLQSPEDYYQRFLVSSLIRSLRFIFMLFSLLLPSIYIAVLTYHQEMVPTNLIISIAGARESVPFPVFIEALIMEVAFEALREAGVRLPKQVGSAVSIVGALVIGQAAVQAGLVSAPMVIVVAITGIASFMIPYYTQGIALRLLRFPMMLLASTLGLLGIMLGIISIVIHLCSLRSFGNPYLSPLAPLKTAGIRDSIIRAPWRGLNTQPHQTNQSAKFIKEEE